MLTYAYQKKSYLKNVCSNNNVNTFSLPDVMVTTGVSLTQQIPCFKRIVPSSSLEPFNAFLVSHCFTLLDVSYNIFLCVLPI